jgi:hypothetical protein
MDQKYTSDEREFIRLSAFFKKQAERWKEENKLGEEYTQLLETCDKLMEQLEIHAQNRAIVMDEHEQLKSLVKDNARCPKCAKNSHLKLIGTDKSEQGWVSNKYKCRRCNIEFVWNAPNNPWDMLSYVDHLVAGLENTMKVQQLDAETIQQNEAALSQMKANVATLRPVIDASKQHLADLEQKEKIMSEMILKVNKHLMIEKIRMS